MKLPFSQYPSDPFGPLRGLRSPLTTSAIKQRVLERAAWAALRGQLRNILAEFLIVGMAGTAVLKMAGPLELAYTSQRTHLTNQVNATNWTAWANGVGGTNDIRKSRVIRDRGIGQFNRVVLSEKPVNTISTNESHQLLSANNLLSTNILRTEPIAATSVGSHIYPIADIRSLAPDTQSPVWFASASGGPVFSRIRMMGERGEIGFEDGWKTIAVSYTSGDASRDLRDVIAHHTGSTAPLLSKERNQEFSLLLGAAIPVGSVELRAMAGPAYLSSSAAYSNPVSGTTAPPVSLQGFGAVAQISALYQLNSSLGIGINGTASYLPGEFTSGIFASLEYRFGP